MATGLHDQPNAMVSGKVNACFHMVGSGSVGNVDGVASTAAGRIR
jgi:hypothetical protein